MTTTTTADVRVGQALPPLAKSIDQRRIDVYSGVRPRSIHTDPDWVRARGFKAPLAQAMMSTAYVSELMTCLLGEGFVKGGTLSMAFIKPVFAGDRLTVHGVVKERREEAGVTRVVVEVWCQNQDGDKTAVGTASGVIR
jgi:acyl dehydratase